VIASGGVRHGLDVMRGYWLGANMVSVAGPMLRYLLNDNKMPAATDLDAFVEQIHEQMRMTLFLTGASNLKTFRDVAARLDGSRFDRTPD
jgi:isopentenyl diphosphate isomerase/L-lactate dehydrogenase-like FMN-dependent dehydrogenase